MDNLPQVLTNYICDYLKKSDVDNLSIVSKKIHNSIYKYKKNNYCINSHYLGDMPEKFYKYFSKVVVNGETPFEKLKSYDNFSDLYVDDIEYNSKEYLMKKFPNFYEYLIQCGVPSRLYVENVPSQDLECEYGARFNINFKNNIGRVIEIFPNIIKLKVSQHNIFTKPEYIRNNFQNIGNLLFGIEPSNKVSSVIVPDMVQDQITISEIIEETIVRVIKWIL